MFIQKESDVKGPFIPPKSFLAMKFYEHNESCTTAQIFPDEDRCLSKRKRVRIRKYLRCCTKFYQFSIKLKSLKLISVKPKDLC